MKTLKKYLWLWEYIAVALILGVGITAKFVSGLLISLVGVAFIIFGLLRLIPLFKTTSDKLLKWIYTLEIVIMVIIGGVLLYLGINKKDMNTIFGYLIGFVLYARGIIYFFSTTIRKEETDSWKFIAHIIFITIGAMIIAKGGFAESTLGWIVLGIALLTAGFVGYNGYTNYHNYRNEIAAKNITKKVKDKKVTNPTSEEIVPNDEHKIDAPAKEQHENEINA